jgi:hypothetical protein
MMFPNLFNGLSVNPRKTIAGPIVIKIYNSDGGYLVALIKERTVKTGVDW